MACTCAGLAVLVSSFSLASAPIFFFSFSRPAMVSFSFLISGWSSVYLACRSANWARALSSWLSTLLGTSAESPIVSYCFCSELHQPPQHFLRFRHYFVQIERCGLNQLFSTDGQ